MLVRQDDPIEYEEIRSDAIAVLRIAGTRYEITDSGILGLDVRELSGTLEAG